MVAVIFAELPAAAVLLSPLAVRAISEHGALPIYAVGLTLVAMGTAAFAVAALLPNGTPFAAWCVDDGEAHAIDASLTRPCRITYRCMVTRVVQGLGGTLADSAIYVIIHKFAPAEELAPFQRKDFATRASLKCPTCWSIRRSLSSSAWPSLPQGSVSCSAPSPVCCR